MKKKIVLILTLCLTLNGSLFAQENRCPLPRLVCYEGRCAFPLCHSSPPASCLPLVCNPCPPVPPPVPGCPPLPMHGKDCPKPEGCCYPMRFCSPYCNPYAPPPEECCCPPAPIRGTSYGLSVVTMTIPIILIVGVAAVILSQSQHTH